MRGAAFETGSPRAACGKMRFGGEDMTELLQKAFEEATKLPEEDQDVIAKAVLAELASERRWDELFAASADRLAELAEEALTEHRAGRTEPLELGARK